MSRAARVRYGLLRFVLIESLATAGWLTLTVQVPRGWVAGWVAHTVLAAVAMWLFAGPLRLPPDTRLKLLLLALVPYVGTAVYAGYVARQVGGYHPWYPELTGDAPTPLVRAAGWRALPVSEQPDAWRRYRYEERGPRASGGLTVQLDEQDRVQYFILWRRAGPGQPELLVDWQEGGALRMGEVDEGESRPLRYKMSPLVRRRPLDPSLLEELRAYFDQRATVLPEEQQAAIAGLLSTPPSESTPPTMS